MLNCSISGFDSNLPSFDYDWTLNDALIPHPHTHSINAALIRSPAELAINPKFVVSLDGSELSLAVNNPSMCTSRFFSILVC